jgi:hypothetical protein
MSRRALIALASAVALLAAVPLVAQQKQTNMQQAGDIAKQPGRDVGIVKTKIPPLLQETVKDPYGLSGLGRCDQIADAVDELTSVLGPDFVAGDPLRQKRKIKVTGDTVAGLIVPFRGVVREVSGAASAQRALNRAIDAGMARRGFLRGVYQARGCKPAL